MAAGIRQVQARCVEQDVEPDGGPRFFFGKSNGSFATLGHESISERSERRPQSRKPCTILRSWRIPKTRRGVFLGRVSISFGPKGLVSVEGAWFERLRLSGSSDAAVNVTRISPLGTCAQERTRLKMGEVSNNIQRYSQALAAGLPKEFAACVKIGIWTPKNGCFPFGFSLNRWFQGTQEHHLNCQLRMNPDRNRGWFRYAFEWVDSF